MRILGLLLLITISLLMFSSCEVQNKPRLSPFPEFTVTGSEVWIIDGNEYSIIETAILIFPGEKPFLAVKVAVNSPVDSEKVEIAKSIAKYAVDNGYIKKAIGLDVKKNNKPIEISKDIGVSMIYQTGKGIISKSSGYNFKFTENELTSNHNKN